mmetsp:Transcript_14281/g.40895  ORF Transcript_14281/g.40895 Transcript_14281/m.40895 type:complete len:298 (+) Transcript_14281:506-1399(+)
MKRGASEVYVQRLVRVGPAEHEVAAAAHRDVLAPEGRLQGRLQHGVVQQVGPRLDVHHVVRARGAAEGVPPRPAVAQSRRVAPQQLPGRRLRRGPKSGGLLRPERPAEQGPAFAAQCARHLGCVVPVGSVEHAACTSRTPEIVKGRLRPHLRRGADARPRDHTCGRGTRANVSCVDCAVEHARTTLVGVPVRRDQVAPRSAGRLGLAQMSALDAGARDINPHRIAQSLAAPPPTRGIDNAAVGVGVHGAPAVTAARILWVARRRVCLCHLSPAVLVEDLRVARANGNKTSREEHSAP